MAQRRHLLNVLPVTFYYGATGRRAADNLNNLQLTKRLAHAQIGRQQTLSYESGQ